MGTILIWFELPARLDVPSGKRRNLNALWHIQHLNQIYPDDENADELQGDDKPINIRCSSF